MKKLEQEQVRSMWNVSGGLANANRWLDESPNRDVEVEYLAKPTDEWGRKVDDVETAFAPDYDTEEYSNPALVMLNMAEFSMMAEAVGVAPPWEQQAQAEQPLAGTRWLDVGCGTGRIALYGASLGSEVTAFDQTAAYLEVTASKANRLPEGVREPDLQVMPVEAALRYWKNNSLEKYDYISAMFAVINHCKDWPRALQEMSVMLAEDGKVVLSMYGSPEAAVFEELREGLPYAPAILVRRVEGGLLLGDSVEDVLPAKFPYPKDVVRSLENDGLGVQELIPLLSVTSLYPRDPSARNIEAFLEAVSRQYGSEMSDFLAAYRDDPEQLLMASFRADYQIPVEMIDKAAYYGIVATKQELS